MYDIYNYLAPSNLCSRNCLLSIVTRLDLLLTRIIMLCPDLEQHSTCYQNTKNKNQFKSELNNKLLVILKKIEDVYIRILI